MVNDHDFSLQKTSQKTSQKSRNVYMFRKAKFSKFKDYISINKDDCFSFVSNHTVEEGWIEFLGLLKEGLAKFIPIKTVRERKEPRWVKPKLCALHRKQRFLHA